MRKYKLFIITSFFITLITACGDKDDPSVEPVDENSVNEWIYKTMDTHYLWYGEMPAKSSLNMNQEPEAFFNKLLSEKDGKVINEQHYYFSTIEKTLTKAGSDDDVSYGFDFSIYRIQNTNYMYAQVIYVIPNSPAYKAGLKRGDWIVSVGTNETKITDYSVLESGGEVVFNLATYHSDLSKPTLIPNGSLKIEAARLVENTPFLKDTVLYIGGKNIGYLAYNHFSSGPDDSKDKIWDNQMKELFAKFKSKQVNEFVLDLRYNGGGLVSSAILLSSLLAPSEALGDVFGYMIYNDKNKNRSTLYFEKPTTVSSGNLNLKRLYVLTGSYTASASEAVINMLRPYMDSVWIIGKQTLGKNVGSETFGKDKNHGYLLHPITLRIYNKEEKADYDDGFKPNIKIEELVFGKPLYEFGEPNELLLQAAIQEITGFRSAPLSIPATSTEIIYQPRERKGIKGLLIDIDK